MEGNERKVYYIFKFPVVLGILIFAWIPALVFNYPGIIVSDYTWQFNQALGKTQLKKE